MAALLAMILARSPLMAVSCATAFAVQAVVTASTYPFIAVLAVTTDVLAAETLELIVLILTACVAALEVHAVVTVST